jgi:hypothetical protein
VNASANELLIPWLESVEVLVICIEVNKRREEIMGDGVIEGSSACIF